MWGIITDKVYSKKRVCVWQKKEQIGVEFNNLRPDKETDAATCESVFICEMCVE
jgi:hypothetical protein